MGRSGSRSSNQSTSTLAGSPPRSDGGPLHGDRSQQLLAELRNRQLRGEVRTMLHKLERGELGILSAGRLALLIAAYRHYDGPDREHVRRDAQTVFLAAVAGFVEQTLRGYGARGVEREVLRQEALIGVREAMDGFDSEHGASPLTYVNWKIRNRLSTTIRNDGRLIRLSSHMDDAARRIQLEKRRLEASGISPTPELVADGVKDNLELVRELWQHVDETPTSLHTPVGDADREPLTLEGVLADELDLEQTVADRQLREWTAELVRAKLSLADRLLVERVYGLGEHATHGLTDVELELVLTDPASLDEAVAAGALSLDPGSPQARELQELLGVQLTTDEVQRRLRNAQQLLRDELERSLADEFVYRGPDAIESSRFCEQKVRAELAHRIEQAVGHLDDPALGQLTVGRLNRMKPGRPVRGGVRHKTDLRLLAERHALADEHGALLWQNFTSGDELPKPAGRRRGVPRITLAQLLADGAIGDGQRVYANVKGERVWATIRRGDDGTPRVVLDGGRGEFTSLSSASKQISNEENGWARFKLDLGGETLTLGRLRDRHLDAQPA
jgi:DNA-directed RNA polymerase sigma subunit (sigma70/sigma32)